MAAKHPDKRFVYEDKLFVQIVNSNSSDIDTGRLLQHFLGQRPREIQHSLSADSSFIAILPNCVDLYERKAFGILKDGRIRIDLVPISYSIRVSGLPKRSQYNLKKEFEHIFGSHRIRTTLCSDDTAWISFENGADVEELCARCNTVGGQNVKSEVHHWQLENERSVASVDVYIKSEERLRFLQKTDITKYVIKKIHDKGLNGHWKTVDGALKALGETDQIASDISHALNDSIVKIPFELNKESMQLLSESSWEETMENIKSKARNKVDIYIDNQNHVLTCYSTDEDGGLVKEFVQDYLTANTVTETKLQLSIETYRTLENNWQQLSHTIESELKVDKVKVILSRKDVTIKGTELGVWKARQRVETLLGTKLHTPVEKDNIALDLQTQGLLETARYSAKQHTISVVVGDITELHVDAIVSITNKDMKHLGGLAKALTVKGGSSIQDECDNHVREYGPLTKGHVFCSSAGKLKCHKLIHTLGPVWQDGNHDEEQMLWEAVDDSLTKACQEKLSSVALPALGAGVNGVPVSTSTKTICEAVRDFFKDSKYPRPSLKRIFLCDIKSENADRFIESLKALYGEDVISENTFTQKNQTWTHHKTLIRPRQTDNATYQRVNRADPNAMDNQLTLRWYEVSLLQRNTFLQELESKYQGLLIEFDKNQNLTLHSSLASLSNIRKDILQYLLKIKSYEQSITDAQKRCLQDSGIEQHLREVLTQRNIHWAVWEINGECLKVFATGEQNAIDAVSIILEQIKEIVITITGENIDFIRSPKWQSHMSRIKDQVQVYLAWELKNKTLVVVTLRNQANNVKRLVENILEGKTVQVKTIAIPSDTIYFLRSPEQQRTLRNIEVEYHVVIDLQSMTIRGTEIQLEKTKHRIRQLVRSNNLQLTIKGKEMTPFEFSLRGGTGLPVEIKRYTKDVFTIILMKGDITELKVDVIVSPTNTDLKGDCDLAKAIAKKAGRYVEEQCTKKIEHNGDLNEGDIFCSSAGDLPCVSIIHAVCPVSKAGNKEALQQIVLKCLRKANSENYKSLASPVLGTGVFSAPPDIDIGTMMNAVMEFYACENQYHLIEIYLCCTEKEHVDICQKIIPDHLKIFSRAKEQSWKYQAVTRILATEKGFLTLINRKAARRYLDEQLQQTVAGKYEIHTDGKVIILAQNESCAEEASTTFDNVIVKRRISTSEPRKFHDDIVAFSSRHQGKVHYEYEDRAIVFYCTHDVTRSEDFTNLLKKQSWKYQAVTRILATEEGYVKLVKKNATRHYLDEQFKQTVAGKYEIQADDKVVILAQNESCAEQASTTFDNVIVKRRISTSEPRKFHDDIVAFSNRHQGKVHFEYEDKAIVFYCTHDVTRSEDFTKCSKNIAKKCVIL